jgi:hypothetical protein
MHAALSEEPEQPGAQLIANTGRRRVGCCIRRVITSRVGRK